MILFRIALRNIFATKVRTLIIGLLVTFGTVLVVLGGSLLSTLEYTMSKSIIGSVSGHLQLYSKDAKDPVEFFSPPTGTPNLGSIDDFRAMKKTVEGVDGVEAVVPMGSDFAIVFSGNIMDIKLAELREAQRDGDQKRFDVLADHIRRIVSMLGDHMDNLKGFVREDAASSEDMAESLENLERVNSEEFWTSLAGEGRESGIVFLENKIAKLAMDESMLFLRYIGTDTASFVQNFELFEMVKGEMIPPGQRGFLFSEFIYERMVKHQVARRLDRIKEWVDADKKIADDNIVSKRVDMNVRQYKDIIFQLDGEATTEVAEKLRKLMNTEETDMVELVKSYLEMTDENFQERYDFFYAEIAPNIILYTVPIGEILTVRAFTRSGYSTSVNVKVYGTYQFRGMEKSALSGVYNLMDLMTYRDLYGYMTEEQTAEILELKAEAEIEVVDRASAEDELFGGDAELVEEVDGGGFDEFADIDMAVGGMRYTDELMDHVYSQDDLWSGVTTNAAVRLKEGVDVADAKERVQAALDAGEHNITVVDWRAASGLVGQFVGVVWIVLVTAIFIIFLVALVIINNSMVMATLDRTREIGTMRAIGAQRKYILKMFLIESSVLAVGFGLFGTALGAGIVMTLNHFGIPAVSDELYFIFAGPKLHPMLTTGHIAAAFAANFLTAVASTVYPAMLATRIEPVKAMGKED
jgi:ABC-type lipoprotein release transport system permease subunit